MPGTKPANTDTDSPYNLAAATAEMMWACALATTRVTVASTARGLELWSHLLRIPAEAPIRAPAAAPCIAPEALPEPAAAAPDAAAGAETAAAGETSGEPSPFASYRSSGGHAMAQVTVSG